MSVTNFSKHNNCLVLNLSFKINIGKICDLWFQYQKVCRKREISTLKIIGFSEVNTYSEERGKTISGAPYTIELDREVNVSSIVDASKRGCLANIYLRS